MKAEQDWSGAIRKVADLITPTAEQWPANWRSSLASAGQTTGHIWFDTRPDHRLVLAFVDSGSGTSLHDELARLLVRVGLLGRGWLSPAMALEWLNRSLLQVTAEPPLIGLTLVTLDPATGQGQVARAGLPPAVVLNPGETPVLLTGPAPFLGVAEVSFSQFDFQLIPGTRLILASAGRPDQVAAAAQRWEELPGQASAEAMARDLLAQTAHPGGVMVLVLEQLAALRIAG